ncbi:phosphatase PAP2 family protein [Allocoleopsis franciscana]|uniref:Membrane-associated phospholipid phosphatase n=1 Tax=Allocoleopsis franciscana PCC 7113 TaxID=1173027 RepID=K9WHN0_9CYAN|nr:phosphatase PAP2 family protein [Allocoleopsis franciscana]AFZ19920.1 membrane-associated phospholipid phosphatase [Allocoleopsis franciscana PCC 7113]
MFELDFRAFLESFLSFGKKLLLAHWRSLLLLFIGVYLPLQVFGELAEEVWENEGGFPWDVPILLAVHSTSSTQMDGFATILTKLGVFWGVFPVASVIGLVLLLRRRWRSLTYLLTTLFGSIIINRTAKVLLHRVRPHLWTSPAPEFDYGFPSGHAMSSMTLVAALVILTWNSRWRLPVGIIGSVFVLAIGWTRLYLGVHYPSDILAGWMVSIAWAIGVSLLIRPNLTKLGVAQDREPDHADQLTPMEEEAVTEKTK